MHHQKKESTKNLNCYKVRKRYQQTPQAEEVVSCSSCPKKYRIFQKKVKQKIKLISD